MSQLLGLVLLSFFVTSLFMVPFIDLLYYLRSKYKKSIPKGYNDQNTPIHNKLLAGKDVDTPVGGGILPVVLVPLLSIIIANFFGSGINTELFILILTFLSFGAIGLLDDGKKIFAAFSGKYKGLRGRYLFVLQTIFAVIVSYLLYRELGLNNIYISGIGNLVIDYWYIPFATFIIVAFSNALNISDGLDGLSSGLLLICLFALLALASANLDITLSSFIGLWIGALFAYLYFNIYPARIYLGDAGAFAFGATLAVVGLLTGKAIALAIIGGVYVIIVGSSALQIISKKFFGKKILPVTPLHMYFRYIGWEEPKVVMRFWLAAGIFAIFGLWLALLSR
jgi:phospho-N-acetylmuramoyl-pentapeptide-transferase